MFSRKHSCLLVSVLAIGTVALASCGTSSSNEIEVVFVPSRDATTLGSLADELAPILDEQAKAAGYDYTFHMSVSTSYSAATTALTSGTADVAFLTGSSYAAATVDYPGKVSLMFTAERDGYKVQTIDYPATDPKSDEGRHTQVEAMNGEIDDYVYRGEQDSTNPADSYNSILIANKGKMTDADGGKLYIDDFIGNSVGIQGPQSGAGYLYPKLFLASMKDDATREIWFRPDSPYLNNSYIAENGLTIVDGTPDASKGEIQGVSLSGYDAAFTEAMNPDSDLMGVWGFMDIRYANGYSKSGTDYYQNDEVFTDTYTVAMTNPIFNDTISYRSDLSSDAVAATKAAFLGAVKDGSKTEEGTGAYLIYNIYSHTGYAEGVDSNYDDERTIYEESKTED